MYNAVYLSPMIPSYNLQETVTFFTGLLGFYRIVHHPNYAVLIKNNLSIHILEAGADIGQMEFYLEVDDLDSLWNSIKDKLEGIQVKEPFDREYGMREFHVIVPHTKTLLFVGQDISQNNYQ